MPQQLPLGTRRLDRAGWPRRIALISALAVTHSTTAGAGSATAAGPAGADLKRSLLQAYSAPLPQQSDATLKLDLTLRGDLRRGEALFAGAPAKGDPMDGAGAGLELRVYPPDADLYASARGRLQSLCGPVSYRPEADSVGDRPLPPHSGDADARILDGAVEIGRLLDPPPSLPRFSSRLGLGLWGMTRRIDAAPEGSAPPLTDRWFGPIGAGRVDYALPPWCFLFAEAAFAPVVLHATSGRDDRDWGGHAAELNIGLTVEPLERLTLEAGYAWTQAESGRAAGGRSTADVAGPFLQLRVLW